MSRKSHRAKKSVTRRTVALGLGTGILAGIGPFNIVRAQGAALKVGVLLPRSGVQAGIGQDCQRGVDIAPGRCGFFPALAFDQNSVRPVDSQA